MNRSILVIVGDQKHDRFSLEKAQCFAGHLDASIDVVRFLSSIDTSNKQLCETAVAQARADLEQDSLAVLGSSSQVDCHVIADSDIASWVVNACKQKHFDLVVKTGHRTENLFHTPTDWKLIRQLDCPILIACDHKWRSKQVLMAAVDVSTQARKQALNNLILQWTALLSAAFSCVPYVVYSIPIAKPLLELDIVEKNDYLKSKKPAVEKQLAKLLDDCELAHANTHITAGPPEKTLAHVANELKADVVIMGCVRRKGVKGFLLGNTAEKVLHHLRTDILIVEASD